MRTNRNFITICPSFAICQDAFHPALVVLVAQEVRLQVEGHLQGVPVYQVEEAPQAHRNWVGEREVRPEEHRGLHRWGGKGGHPGGMEALNI